MRPDGINQFSYSKEKVTHHLGSASALFAVDQLVSQTVRQTLGWLTSMAGFLQQVPGVDALLSILRAIVQLVADSIDGATMSYTLTREGENI